MRPMARRCGWVSNERGAGRMIRGLLVWALTATAAQADFVINNLRYTLYHELGHAVIDLAEVPVFGMEENAADAFALVLADRLLSEAALAEMVWDVVALGRRETVVETFDPWDEYQPGGQRLARTICLYYGMGPDARLATARAMGMPTSSTFDCAEDATATARAWRTVLRDLAPEPGATPVRSLRGGGRGKTIRLLEDDIDAINAVLVLPRPVPVTQARCGDDNAYYYTVEERIEFCAEMFDALNARRP